MVCLELAPVELSPNSAVTRGIVIGEMPQRAQAKSCYVGMEEQAPLCPRDAGAYIALRKSGAKPQALIRAYVANLIRYRARRKTGS
jgi:hypothetical protein